eukprot:3245399-Rhodomonas_salina.1
MKHWHTLACHGVAFKFQVRCVTVTARLLQAASEGEDHDLEDSFAPVPHTTSASLSGQIIISIAAAQDLELHSCDLRLRLLVVQAFIQTDKLD